MIRSVFRVVEYAQGSDGCLLHREVWLYIFDALLMVVVMLLFNVIHPSVIGEPEKAQTGIEAEAINLGKFGPDGAVVQPLQNFSGDSDAV